MFDNFIKRDGKTAGIKVLITLTWIFLFVTWALMLAGVVLFFLGNALITVDFFSFFFTPPCRFSKIFYTIPRLYFFIFFLFFFFFCIL